MVSDNVMQKIHALLNMTVTNGCTQDEANTAMEKAQALMLQHNVDMRDINTGEVKDDSGRIGVVEKDYGFFVWKAVLMNVIAKNMLCSYVRSPQKKVIHLFGTKENTSIVVEMYDWISLQLEQMALRDFNQYKKRGGYVTGLTWKNTYFNVAVNEVAKRLKKPYQDFAQGTGRSIVVYNDKAVAEAVRRVFPRISHSTHNYRVNAGAEYGRTAGQNVSLRPQTKIGGQRLALT